MLDVEQLFYRADETDGKKFHAAMMKFLASGFNPLTIVGKIKEYQRITVDGRTDFETFDDLLLEIERLKKMGGDKITNRKTGVIYKDDSLKIIGIGNFIDAKTYGSDTVWCTSNDEDEFNAYFERYEMFIIIDKNGDERFNKVCYLRNSEGDFFVGRDNVHRYKGSNEYEKLKEKVMKFLN